MKAVCSIVLSQNEADYLLSAGFLPSTLHQHLQSAQSNYAITLELSPEMAEEFREVFTEQLARVGFNEAYEPTKEGRLLEDLIDRFFCP